MLTKVIIYLIGISLTVIGILFSIIYLNILSIGYNLTEYFTYIITKIECWLIPIGLILVILAIYRKGDQ